MKGRAGAQCRGCFGGFRGSRLCEHLGLRSCVRQGLQNIQAWKATNTTETDWMNYAVYGLRVLAMAMVGKLEPELPCILPSIYRGIQTQKQWSQADEVAWHLGP